jgi:hypothetical protein
MFFPSRFTFFIVVVREGKERKQGFFLLSISEQFSKYNLLA